ncbi:MAG: hypothetical protein ACKPKO_13605, partial [Candidatus Fonsibacter sp.]
MAEHTETVVAIGDPNQRVVSVRAWRSTRAVTRFLDHDENEVHMYPSTSSASGSETDPSHGSRDALVWIDQLLRGPDRATHIDFWKLTETKRCSQPLVGFVRRLLPAEAGDLKASSTLKLAPQIRCVFYKASPGTWRNFDDVGGLAKESWAKTVVVWQSGLVVLMATRILQLL